MNPGAIEVHIDVWVSDGGLADRGHLVLEVRRGIQRALSSGEFPAEGHTWPHRSASTPLEVEMVQGQGSVGEAVGSAVVEVGRGGVRLGPPGSDLVDLDGSYQMRTRHDR